MKRVEEKYYSRSFTLFLLTLISGDVAVTDTEKIKKQILMETVSFRFLRNPSELKSIKNISLLRQQMEAQAQAQQLAAQQAAQAAVLSSVSCHRSPVKREEEGEGVTSEELPTDLSTGGQRASLDRERGERERERAERERYYSQLMERYNIERSSPARDRSEERETEPKSHFDYRHLIPQVSIKTETC